jgi:hypothetical protein
VNVKIIKTGKVETVSASYGMRLIEQGKAVLVPKPTKKPDRKEAAKAGDA